ncbi:SDR family oxidoreductase [Micromonospora polyrhachis]|uniref:NAD(P)-dependent dehydrogenase (Short-subunit alcohol dehydrogenase family) n=1 Tax=Micromonospora polyrhachis TaxID=1282883 RepID=A0A7W7STE0_9ACTN|nr:SDR family oxidoreductase [Micromonospora polyrhachis]MBB4960569.1 NAD(P)-dependent dehydrogenase (short-subunit alcohol dehydrogenase family) [Micromonospora polyrhachis]
MNEPKIALVTGANKGIGYEIARGLGETGAIVLVGARNMERGTVATEKLTAEGITAIPVQLEVTDPVSVSAAAARIEREYGRLDILVNNAGILLEGGQRPSQMPVDLLERTYATNVFAVVAVTNAMLPLIRRAAAGRIVNISSGLGSLAITSDPHGPYAPFPLLAYNSSKSALNSITISYANELRDTPIKVNAADPGYCATDLNAHAGPRTPAQGAIAAIRLATLLDDGPTAGFFSEEGTEPW